MYVKLFLDIKKDSGGWNIYRRKELFPLNCILIRILKFNKWTQYVQLFGGDEETARMWGNQIATQSAIFRFWCHTLQTYSVEVLLQLNCHSISAKNLKDWESIIKFTKQFSSLAWVCNTLQSDMYMPKCWVDNIQTKNPLPLLHQTLQQQKTLLQHHTVILSDRTLKNGPSPVLPSSLSRDS